MCPVPLKSIHALLTNNLAFYSPPARCAAEPVEFGVRPDGSIAHIPKLALTRSIWRSSYFGQGTHRRHGDAPVSASEHHRPNSSHVDRPPQPSLVSTVTTACTTVSY
jgi:hypothetical protein